MFVPFLILTQWLFEKSFFNENKNPQLPFQHNEKFTIFCILINVLLLYINKNLKNTLCVEHEWNYKQTNKRHSAIYPGKMRFDKFVSVHSTCSINTISRSYWRSSLSSLIYTLNIYHTKSAPGSEFDRKPQHMNMSNSMQTTWNSAPPHTYEQIHDPLLANT